MKYRELVHWSRKCPRCGTTFQSVQELGRCPGCELKFKADKSGVAYPNSYDMEIVHPALGTIASPAAGNGKEGELREWYI